MSKQPAARDDVRSRPLLDASVLKQLHELDSDGQFVKQLIQTFERDARIYLAQMVTASEDADAVSWRHACHNIASAAGSVGASRLSQHCRALLTQDPPTSTDAFERANQRTKQLHSDTIAALVEKGLL